jgi:Ca-activated chloride channel family protein
MKYKYSKYVPNLLDELDMDELMSKLSDLLMSSGFGNPRDTGDDSDRTMQALHDAILEALFNGGVLPDDLLEKLFGDAAEGNEEQARNQLEELIQQIIERMKESGYISTPPDLEPRKARRAHGRRRRGRAGEVKFEGHRQGARFSGYRACATCSARPGTAARPHDTRDPVDRHRDQRRAESRTNSATP